MSGENSEQAPVENKIEHQILLEGLFSQKLKSLENCQSFELHFFLLNDKWECKTAQDANIYPFNTMRKIICYKYPYLSKPVWKTIDVKYTKV